MPRVSRKLLFGLVPVLLCLALFLFWQSRRPPEITRLLPEADAIVYADLRPARLATHFDRSAPARSPAYQGFVDVTGIVPERDLNEVAFALTRRADPNGPDGPVAYTEIFRGRFDAGRLRGYLEREAVSTEDYAGQTIFALPSGEPGMAAPRLLRVVLLRDDAVAASNAATGEQIHAVIDHARAGWFGGTTPSLLASRFPEVPTLATAWGIGSLGLPFAQVGHVAVLGLELPLPADQAMVASLRYVGVLRLRIAAIAQTPEMAMQQTGALTGLVGLLRTLGANNAGVSPEIAAAIGSITVVQSGTRTIVTADLPVKLFEGLARPR